MSVYRLARLRLTLELVAQLAALVSMFAGILAALVFLS